MPEVDESTTNKAVLNKSPYTLHICSDWGANANNTGTEFGQKPLVGQCRLLEKQVFSGILGRDEDRCAVDFLVLFVHVDSDLNCVK